VRHIAARVSSARGSPSTADTPLGPGTRFWLSTVPRRVAATKHCSLQPNRACASQRAARTAPGASFGSSEPTRSAHTPSWAKSHDVWAVTCCVQPVPWHQFGGSLWPLTFRPVRADAVAVDVPVTRYARSDDVHIAYQVFGSGSLDVVVVPGFVSHLELGWQDPVTARLRSRLASFARVLVFDKRGTGMSDRISGPQQSRDDPSLRRRGRGSRGRSPTPRRNAASSSAGGLSPAVRSGPVPTGVVPALPRDFPPGRSERCHARRQ
jgi:hypothetical protein